MQDIKISHNFNTLYCLQYLNGFYINYLPFIKLQSNTTYNLARHSANYLHSFYILCTKFVVAYLTIF